MEQDDEEFEQLLGEIPRATSAPPHLEELQRAYGGELNNSPFVVAVGEGGRTLPPVKPFIDIRCDEQYENFYRAYSGAKKLPPPMENRSLYAEFPNTVSPKSNSHHVSPFFSGLALDSPRSIAVLRSRQKQEQMAAQISSTNVNLTNNSVRTSPPPSDHLLHPNPQSSMAGDDRSLSSAFGNLSFEDSSATQLSTMLGGGRLHEENGIGGADNRGASNGVGLDHGVVGVGCSNHRGAPNSSGLYSHSNPFSSSGFGQESAPPLVGAFVVNRSPSAAIDLFTQKNAGGSAGVEAPSNGSSSSYGGLEGYDGHTVQAFEYLRIAPSHGNSLDNHASYSSSSRPNNNAVIMDGFGNGSPVQQHQRDAAVYPGGITTRLTRSPVSPPSANGSDFYSNGSDIDNYSARITFQHRLQMQFDAQQKTREMHLIMQQQQQQMRLYATFQAHANGGGVGNGSNSYPSSRGHSPTEPSSRQSSLHQAAGSGVNHPKNARNHEQQHLWNIGRGGVTIHGNGDTSRIITNGLCRYYAQGYCSRGDACPFLHNPAQAFGPGRGISGCDFKEASREERLLVEKMLPRTRMASRTANGPASIPAINPAIQRRKPDSLSNGNALSINGLPYGNGNHHPSPIGFHGEAQNICILEDTVEYDGNRHAIVGPQHLSPHNQQPKYNTLEEVEGRIFSIAKDQHGCRFLQRKFDEGGPEDVQKIFNEIIDHIIELMTDPFGNYLVQKLLEVCNEAQRMEILHVVTGKGELSEISLNMHGTRAVQKLIETLKSAEQVAMVISSLKPGVVKLIKDLNGNHVVQRCLQRLSPEDSQFIFDAAALHCVDIATHRHGCCVLQRCVDFASGAQRHSLVKEIAANANALAQDAFGNYVVQYVLDLGIPEATTEVMDKLQGYYPYLAMQKFSSNVVEKCLKLANEEYRGRIVRELVQSTRLGQMLQDPYANYVVQSALSIAKGSLHSELVDAIRPHLSVLRSSPYGKRILSRTNLKK